MSSSDEDENPLIKFGTPLEEPDETELVKKPVAVHEQIVTDSEGRRRFHGAFTGGFSAGYYNTVDTKDGWKPSTFRSSRQERKKNKVFAPEDFMDEEDMSEFGIAPKKIVTQSSFSSNKGSQQMNMKEKFAKNATMLLGLNMLQSLVIPVSSNIGVKLLQKMGWKPGQGIGPKIRRRKKDDFIPENVTFAPEDTVPMDFSPKENVHGIGYSGMDPTLALHGKHKNSSALSLRTKSGAKLSFAGQAFGVGAYEDEDQDIYALDSMANYDLVMGEEKQNDAYGWSRPTKAIKGSRDVEAITFIKKVLEGFKKAEKYIQRKVYPPPELPLDFDPNKRLILQKGRTPKGFFISEYQSSTMKEKNQPDRLNPTQRRQLLEGEQQQTENLDKQPKSVFDLMLPRDRERFEKLRSGDAQPQPARREEDKKQTFNEPFAPNSAKQSRYNQYLSALKEKKIDPYEHIEHDPHMTEWEKQQEQEEFSRSSRFFQPLSATMSSRFAPESQQMKEQDEKEKALKNAAKMKLFGIMTRESLEWHPDPLLCKRFNVPNPYPNSEIVGVPSEDLKEEMFLHPDDFIRKKTSKPFEQKSLTHETQPAGGKILSDTKYPPTFGKIKSLNKSSRWDEKPALQGPSPKKQPEPPETFTVLDEATPHMEHGDQQEIVGTKEASNGDAATDEVQISTERPSMELFKAIFASSEEETSGEEDSADESLSYKTMEQDSESSKSCETGFEDFRGIAGSEKNPLPDPSHAFSTETKPGFHKFCLKSKTEPHTPVERGNQANSQLKPGTDDEGDAFGPALPPPKLPKLWTSTDPARLSGKHKSKKKHKHKEKKKKVKTHHRR